MTPEKLPSLFVNTYQLYKKQTNQLAQWLLDTAGYPSEDATRNLKHNEEPSSGINKPSPSVGSKGKRAKAAANGLGDSKITGGTHTPNSEGSPYSIRLSQFAELARSIAGRARNNFKIPRAIPNLILQIIRMRGSVSIYYKMQTKNAPDDHRLHGDYNKHMYFISVLEGVLDILETVAEPSAGGAAKSHGTSDASRKQAEKISVEELSNRFSALEVEETIGFEDIYALTPSGKSEKPKSTQNRNVVYDAGEFEDEEIDFAVFCLFEDLRRIRRFFEQVWQDYKTGKLDLMTASVITNTAFGFAQTIDAGFCRLYPTMLSPQFHNNPIIPMYILNCMKAEADINYREHPNDIYNYEMQEIGEFLYLPVYLLLESFSRVLKPGHIPLAKKGYFGIYDPKSDRGRMTYRQKST